METTQLHEGTTIIPRHTTDFSLVEQDKENIKPIPQGRSVRKLADTVQLDNTQLEQKLGLERQEFENRLDPINLESLDDPLEPYIEYLRWIRESFPSGNNNSELIQLLEKATHDFKDDEYYKNEIRYFKIWLEYINFSDTPREIYTYLFRKQIGCRLSLFYESYAGFMEGQHDFQRAKEIYEMGLKCKAVPVRKLERAYEMFKQRMEKTEEENDPECREKPAVVGLSNGDGTGLQSHSQKPSDSRPKFQVFTDDSSAQPSAFNQGEGRDSLDPIGNLRKENKVQSLPFKGQVIPQISSGPKVKARKFTVFQDKPALTYPVTETVAVPGKRTAKYDLNFELFFPKDAEPRTVYEVLAMMTKRVHKRRKSVSSVQETPTTKRVARGSMTPSASRRGSSFLIGSLNEDGDTTKLTQSPTLTFFSNQARKEILQMFNQPANTANTTTSSTNEEHAGASRLSDFVTETLTGNTIDTPQQHRKSEETESLLSSPFFDTPLRISLHKIVDPDDQTIKDQQSISHYPGYHNYDMEMNKLGTLQTMFKPGMPPIMGDKRSLLNFEGSLYCVTKELASGLYLCEKSTGEQYALKVRKEGSSWEFYVLSELARRSTSLLKSYGYYKYRDESYLILPYFKQGSIMQLVDSMKSVSIKMTESLAAYFAIQILRQVIQLHTASFVHCQIGPDSCMVSFEQTIKRRTLSYADISLTDYSRAMDLSLYSHGVGFQAKGTEDFLEILKEKEYWTYEPDYYGAAKIIHTLIFGNPLHVHKVASGILPDEMVNNNWSELWTELLDELLNPYRFSKDGIITEQLQKTTKRLENWMEFSSNPGSIVRMIDLL
ncbi:DEKNAAC101550 [Brettanomyces naardenensis]|uniref:DEKNAAC101550 n=1 Tax=Brettanomyces naardenensis TaxID=13370 RepID=A0A448YII8_BRENA|nr:DEKNAAC101550 [Brettanomyces naardenensis]